MWNEDCNGFIFNRPTLMFLLADCLVLRIHGGVESFLLLLETAGVGEFERK